MFQKNDGQMYAPVGRPDPVCNPEDFKVGVISLDHGHIYGMCNGLKEAGAGISLVYDPDKSKAVEFQKKFPEVMIAESEKEVLENEEIRLIASSAIPDTRGSIGIKALEHGKDYFSDKPPFTTQEQVDTARRKVKETHRIWSVYYSERLHVESAVYAEELLKQGVIGDVVALRGWGPHRMGLSVRPDWFYDRNRFGGIITDIGSHQLEQILFYSGAQDARLVSSRIANYAHPQYPLFEDFGDATFIADNGVSAYFSVDWFTPDGLGTWGDGRTLILGTEGYIELRKYIDVGVSKDADNVILVTNKGGEKKMNVSGKVGFPFFGRLIRDCLDRTETAMAQEHVFRTIELAIEAQTKAIRVR